MDRPSLTPVTSRLAAFGTRLRGAGAAVWDRFRRVRDAGGAAQTGMHRLFDLHAASCAGDALVAVGLAGTIFFNVPVGEARTRVALYLLVTMLPFALLAPLVGPVLDRFRHGRRYALATTMLTRGFLAYAIADQMGSWFLYPAAFGVLVMSKAYGVARSAAVPRLLPPGLTLVATNARASLIGTVVGGLLAVVGVGLAQIGPEWTLRLSTVVFAIGMVIALRLPPRADSDPPERLPHVLGMFGRRNLALWDAPIWTAITASGALRALYGFLTLFFAFRTRTDDLGPPAPVAFALVIAALGLGSFVATVAGTRLRIAHPQRLNLIGLTAVAVGCLIAAVGYSLVAAMMLGFLAAAASGLAKLAIDAEIQGRLPDETRASAFAHSETLLQLAWVFGGAIGLIPVTGPWGLFVASLGVGAAATMVATRLRTVHREASAVT